MIHILIDAYYRQCNKNIEIVIFSQDIIDLICDYLSLKWDIHSFPPLESIEDIKSHIIGNESEWSPLTFSEKRMPGIIHYLASDIELYRGIKVVETTHYRPTNMNLYRNGIDDPNGRRWAENYMKDMEMRRYTKNVYYYYINIRFAKYRIKPTHYRLILGPQFVYVTECVLLNGKYFTEYEKEKQFKYKKKNYDKDSVSVFETSLGEHEYMNSVQLYFLTPREKKIDGYKYNPPSRDKPRRVGWNNNYFDETRGYYDDEPYRTNGYKISVAMGIDLEIYGDVKQNDKKIAKTYFF
eukprot:35855_1